ncbi:hypothetical protein DL98DRAFT_572384 [Cadophora sp. DSE1049]|nr:hypothetical protein DL98DRAFT_572384 [Cadophora sp. DSE1049]
MGSNLTGRHGSASSLCSFLLLCLVLAATANAALVTDPPIHRKFGKYFDRPSCKASILKQQENNASFSLNNALYFRVDPATGLYLNGAENMTVTKRGCDEFCGGWSFYWDAIPRLMTWILPVLLLLSNIELSPIDKKRFMTVIHALGDPIDSFWSLIHKIYIWNRLYGIGLRKVEEKRAREVERVRVEREARREEPLEAEVEQRRSVVEILVSGLEVVVSAIGGFFVGVMKFFARRWRWMRRVLGFQPDPNDEQLGNADEEEEEEETELSTHDIARIIATVLSGFEEISGAKIESEDYYHMIMRRLGRIGEDDEDPDKFEEWRRTARILADARTNEFPRTCLAVGVYIVGLVAAFIPEVGGGNTSPPGGRIASAIFLSWLVPLVLVSNTIGAFTSRRTCLTIMRQFVKGTKPVEMTEETVDGDAQGNDGGDSDDVETSQVSGGGLHASESRNLLARRPTAHVAPDDLSIHSFRGESFEVERTSDTNYAPASHWLNFSESADISLPPYPSTHKTKKLKGVEWNETEISSPPAVEHPEHPNTTELPPLDRSISLLAETTWHNYFESLQWLGSIYTYRPWKVLYLDIDHRTHAHRKNVAMAFFAFLPILVSMIGAFLIIWYAVPVGWNCRHLWLLGIFCSWIASAIWTSVTYVRSKKNADGHKLWVHVLRKDGVIALSGACMILLSTAGLFNNCWCWSAFMLRREDAFVPLEAIKEYENNARHKYSIVVGDRDFTETERRRLSEVPRRASY